MENQISNFALNEEVLQSIIAMNEEISLGQQPKDFATVLPEDLEELAEAILDSAVLSHERAIAHRLNPSEFPISDDLFEQAALELFDESSDSAKQEAAEYVKALIERPLIERSEEFSNAKAIDLRSSESIRNQVQRLRETEQRQLSAEKIKSLDLSEESTMSLLQSVEVLQDLAIRVDEAAMARVAAINTFDLQGNATPIQTKYLQLGEENLGKKVGTEKLVKDNKGRTARMQRYQKGAIYWTPEHGAHAIWGKIYDKYQQMGAHKSFASVPRSDTRTSKLGAIYNHFVNNTTIIARKGGEAHEIHGAIRQAWLRWGGPDSRPCGAPVSDEQVLNSTLEKLGKFKGGRVSKLQRGWMVWSLHDNDNAHFIPDDLLPMWQSLGGESGRIGYPIQDPVRVPLPRQTHRFGWLLRCQGGTLNSGPGAPFIRPFDKVNLVLKEMTCHKMTRWEGGIFGGHDEIDYGGIQVDFDASTTLVNSFRVGKFRDGEREVFNPPKVITTFDLAKGAGWPREAGFICNIAEIDRGGRFDKYLEKFFKAAKDWVEEEVDKGIRKLGQFIESEVGPIVATIVATILGAIADYLLSKLWKALRRFRQDYVFPAVMLSLKMENVFAFGADGEGPTFERTFRSDKFHGGALYKGKFRFEQA
ncbi:LGFP repeat-containing protein [Halomicronema sp. CCY15110]|uniref:LGFP repeat-containing protein n=1 Tax=Halomicronema sp. CCY15110 TaxID=2767773 RepID=UPI00194F8D02|nr:hypothetical protein [Halomicronema sp. CCY15110]